MRKLRGAPLPLMQQVQIAAGALVLAGLILNQLVAPAWILLLRLLPWNQVKKR